MYVFRRTTVAHPNEPIAARAFAVRIAALASEIAGRPITPFEVVFGGPGGGISWSMTVKDMADLEKVQGRLLSNASYLAEVEKGRGLFATAPEDGITKIVANGITRSDHAMYASVTAVPAPGKLAEAAMYGVTVHEYIQSAGFASLFGTSPHGPFGEVGWLRAADSMADLDTWETFLENDPKMVELVDTGGVLFVPGSGVSRLIRRLG